MPTLDQSVVPTTDWSLLRKHSLITYVDPKTLTHNESLRTRVCMTRHKAEIIWGCHLKYSQETNPIEISGRRIIDGLQRVAAALVLGLEYIQVKVVQTT